MPRDPDEEDAVPACPDVEAVAPRVDDRLVPARRQGVPVRLEPEKREDRRSPECEARPEEDLEPGVACSPDPELVPGRRGVDEPLTGAHGAEIIVTG